MVSVFHRTWASPVGEVHLPACRRLGFDPWVRKIPWRRKWHPTAVFLPGKSHGQKSLLGYSPWGHKEYKHTHRELDSIFSNNLNGKIA